MLTLRDVKEAFGLNVTLQQVKNRLKMLEKRTGRNILMTFGEGKHTRYMVRPDELAAAMGAMPITTASDVDDTANKIADAINLQNATIQELKQRLYRCEIRCNIR